MFISWGNHHLTNQFCRVEFGQTQNSKTIYNKVLSVIIDVDLIVFVDSYDDRATTQKILQKLKLENFQVCFLWAKCGAAVPKQTWNGFVIVIFMIYLLLIQLGRTKVFLRAGQIGVLDSRRAEVLDNAAKCIQCRLRTFIAHRDFISIRAAAVSLQACCRGLCCWRLVKYFSLNFYF
jgi:hypothetical protein